MGMMFCRGCAKEIHETAPTCPHCGAVQGHVPVFNNVVPQPSIEDSGSAKFHWTSLTSLITGLVVTLMAISVPEQWDKDTVVGVVMFGLVPILFAVISLIQKRLGRWMAITGLVLGICALLAAIGNGS
ncbi:cell division protein FtsW (lipid II flippase) [Undibacterium sp. GrIS 1.8]|uniref:hypothetical protein n=1 Tax=Undibacterium sp. GrIS 1.8 TaxID=3143934 RepID=UPI0033923DEC